MLVLVTVLLIFLVYILVDYCKTLCYWRKKGIKFVIPLPFFGNSLTTMLQSVTLSEYTVDLYKQFPNERYFGTFQYSQPILLVRDLNLIKRIFTKDFHTFSEHPVPSDPDEDTLWGKNLFASKGETWRNLRKIVNSAFTTAKLRSMFVLINLSANQLMEYLNEKEEGVIEVEFGDMFKRYSSDTIASIAFGIECNSFKDRNNEFIKMGAELTNFGGLQNLKRLLYTVNPKIAKFLKIKMHPDNVTNFFRTLVKESIKSRKNKKSTRPDYIQHLLETRKVYLQKDNKLTETVKTEFSVDEEASVGLNYKTLPMELTDDDITAQALDFFYGGFYSTASLMCFSMYELAVNPTIQQKLRKEIDETLQRDSKKITYDVLNQLKYLEMVIFETLRKWPTATWIDRKTNKSIVIEPERLSENPLFLEAGTVCWVPVFPIQRDPNYWPNPERFDPERFQEDKRNGIMNSAFLPFGCGPRGCLGATFALVEAKLIIIHILLDYEIVPTEKSVLDKNPYLTSGNSFWFGFKRR